MILRVCFRSLGSTWASSWKARPSPEQHRTSRLMTVIDLISSCKNNVVVIERYLFVLLYKKILPVSVDLASDFTSIIIISWQSSNLSFKIPMLVLSMITSAHKPGCTMSCIYHTLPVNKN
jgi:hypothetical protein